FMLQFANVPGLQRVVVPEPHRDMQLDQGQPVVEKLGCAIEARHGAFHSGPQYRLQARAGRVECREHLRHRFLQVPALELPCFIAV
nr:hypothetical protein [Tanacetum cinerariifolium]